MCFLITLLGRWSEAVALALENKENVLARKIVLKARDQGTAKKFYTVLKLLCTKIQQKIFPDYLFIL